MDDQWAGKPMFFDLRFLFYQESSCAKLTIESLRPYAADFILPSVFDIYWETSDSSENLSSKFKVFRNLKKSFLCKNTESCIYRCYKYQGETITTIGEHIFEIDAIQAIYWDKKNRKLYLLQKCNLEYINCVFNLICVCYVCHKYFDDQQLKLQPD